MRTVLSFVLSTTFISTTVYSATYEIGPGDNLPSSIANLQPGDELILQGGTYNLSQRFSIGVSGTAADPIIIRAKQGETPIITRPNANQNTVNIEGADYVTLRGIEITGGSIGIRLHNANYITIEECDVHHTGDVAIGANISDGGTYRGLQFLRNHIHHTSGTGEGFYLGCNNNDCTMYESVIAENYIHDTIVGTAQGDGIEIKIGSHSNLVRDNVIHDTRYPCILVYDARGNPPNIIERNVMWGCGDHAIQAAGEAIIHNNIILGATADGIRNQEHQGAPVANLDIRHNTILVANNAIRSNSISGSVLIANNALYSQNANALRLGGDLNHATVAGNVGSGGTQGVTSGFDSSGSLADFIDAQYGSNAHRDVFPATGSSLIAAGDATHVVPVDFNATDRAGGTDVGAYLYNASGNPGWAITEDFKVIGSIPPPIDAGVLPDATTFPDATVTPDANVADASGVDATPVADSGSPLEDAGTATDLDASNTTAPPTTEEEGCGCFTTASKAPSWPFSTLLRR